MSALKLYFDPVSPPARAVRLFLRAAAVPYQESKVFITRGETRTETYRKLHPFQRVPLLAHGDSVMAESGSILRYLTDRRNRPSFPSVNDHWWPENTEDYYKLDQYFHWHHLGMRLHTAALFQQAFVQPITYGKPLDQGAIEFHASNFLAELEKFSQIFLDGNSFLFGMSDISVADLQAACELTQLYSMHADYKKLNPRVYHWVEKIKTHPDIAPHFDAVHNSVYKIQKLNKIAPF